MEVSQALRAALTQSRSINLLKFIAIKKKKTEKPEKFREKKNWTSAYKRSAMLSLTMIYLKKKKVSQDWHSGGGSWTPWDLFVSWASCPVFKKLEGNEAWCAKHFPRVTPEGKGPW